MSPWSFKEWYEAHGASLNQQRKRRYVDDPVYRQQVLERNRTARKVARATRLIERKAVREATVTNVPRRHMRVVEWDVGGKKLTLFTLGMLAQVLAKSPRTLYKWEAKGLLPETPFRTEKGDRLYTVEQIEEIRAKLESLGKLDLGIKARASGRPPRGIELGVTTGNGKVQPWLFFRAGVLAKVLGRTVETLQEWEGKGILPETPFRVSQKRHRLYSPEMIESVKNALDEAGGLMREDTAALFASRVQTDWKKLGVFGVKLVKPKQK